MTWLTKACLLLSLQGCRLSRRSVRYLRDFSSRPASVCLARRLLEAEPEAFVMRKSVLLAPFLTLACVLGASASSASAESSPAIRIYQSQSDDAISEGETIIAAEPDAAYATAVDYARWTAMFPAIRNAIVTRQAGVDARVTFVYADGHRDNLHFHNRPGNRTLWFEDTGGRATVWAEISFTPGQQAGTTRVHTRIFADVNGVASWFVSDSKVRRMREQRILEDLTHIRTFFASQAVASVP
jgi:hypothetical protein